MKIIKRVEPVAWTFSFTCTKCKSELVAEKSDVKTELATGHHHDAYDRRYVDCPVCQQRRYID